MIIYVIIINWFTMNPLNRLFVRIGRCDNPSDGRESFIGNQHESSAGASRSFPVGRVALLPIGIPLSLPN
jgi:hypothetical protein